MNKVIKKGNLNMTSGQLMGGLNFTAAQNAPILTISYTGGSSANTGIGNTFSNSSLFTMVSSK